MEDERFRRLTMGALNELYLPVGADDLQLSLQVSEGVVASEEALMEMASRDRDSYLAGELGDTLICPALNFPDGEASVEFFTLSSWPMPARVVQDVLSSAQEVHLLRRLCEVFLSADWERSVTLEARPRLLDRIDDLSVHLSGSHARTRLAGLTSTPQKVVVYRELAEDRQGEII